MTTNQADRPCFSRRAVLGAGAAFAAAAVAPRTLRADDRAAARPVAAPNGAGSYRFNVGDLEVVSAGDGNGAMGVYPLWGENASREEVEAALAADFLDTQTAAMTFNVPIVRTRAGIVMFDAGVGPSGRAWGAGRLEAHLRYAGISPEDIAAIVITHLHGDHYGGLAHADGTLAFPNARYFIQKNEADFWTGPGPDLSGSKADPETKQQFIRGAVEAFGRIKSKAEIIDGEKEIVPGVRVEPAFGHTPGHQIAHISDGDRELLLITDCIHHHCLSLRNPGWHLRFDADAAKGAATRARMLDRAAADKALVLAYHMPFPGVGHIRREGKGFEWVPAEWKW